MHIFRTNHTLQQHLQKQRAQGKIIGFVPTLGALHDGHMSLMQTALKQSDVVVCSIFINPTQFNQASDFQKYPRSLMADIELLIQNDVQILYYPIDSEIYPEGLDTTVDIDLGLLGKVMEGAHRPGHFEGVMQVVKRLLDIVDPDKLFMGQKDYQQFTIIRYLLEQFKMPTELIVCPIIREPNGLARSSRNERLSAEARTRAKVIFEILQWCKQHYKIEKIKELEEQAQNKLKAEGLIPEYFSIVDGDSLAPPDEDSKTIVACTAAWIEGVRLIDNIIL